MSILHYKTLWTFILLAACLTLSSCAAILGNSNTNVKFDSEPEGAKVYVNGNQVGRTPVTTLLSSKKDLNVEFRLDGYETTTKMLPTSPAGGWVIADVLLGGLIGVVVDAATGSWNRFDQEYMRVILDPKK